MVIKEFVVRHDFILPERRVLFQTVHNAIQNDVTHGKRVLDVVAIVVRSFNGEPLPHVLEYVERFILPSLAGFLALLVHALSLYCRSLLFQQASHDLSLLLLDGFVEVLNATILPATPQALELAIFAHTGIGELIDVPLLY